MATVQMDKLPVTSEFRTVITSGTAARFAALLADLGVTSAAGGAQR